MSGKKISINPKHRNDPSQRYMMPSFEVRYQGRNQNTKTSLENLEEIAGAVHRPAGAIWKYFGLVFNTRLDKSDDAGVFFLRGTYEGKQLQNKFDKFISSYVLCGDCGNPETDLKLSETLGIYRDCSACGSRSKVTGDKKILNVLVKFGAVKAEGSDEKKKKKKRKKKKKTGDTSAKEEKEEDDGGIVWSAKITKEAKEKRRAELLGKTARQELENLIKAKSFASIDPFIECQTSEGWSDRKFGQQIISIIGSAFYNKDGLTIYKGLLEGLNGKTKGSFLLGVLDGVGVACTQTFPHLKKSLAGVMQKLYASEIVDESSFSKWYEEDFPENKSTKEASKPFFDWLMESSEDEDEE